jgi:dTDP-4-dehydrorhamnose 3,5-epimerase
MVVTKFEIPGLLSFEPKIFEDERGVFYETFNYKKIQEIIGYEIDFCQDNESISKLNVLRGLHFQVPPFAQGKLVRVVKGRVIDVAVDLRKNSDYYGQHQLVELSEENKKQFWIPPGFAHGFISLEENTVFSYKCTNYYSPVSERTIQWNDEKLNINWPIADPIVSEKDQKGLDFTTFVSEFE